MQNGNKNPSNCLKKNRKRKKIFFLYKNANNKDKFSFFEKWNR